MPASGDTVVSGPVRVSESFVAPGYPGPPGPVAEETAVGKLRQLIARRKPNDDVEYYDPDITFQNIGPNSLVGPGFYISYWVDQDPMFTVQDAKLKGLDTWNGYPKPGYNAQTGDAPVNAFTVETMISSHAAGTISVFLYIGPQGGSTQVMINEKPTTATFIDLPTDQAGIAQMNFAVKADCHGKKFSIRIPATVGFFGFIADASVSLAKVPRKAVNAAIIADSMAQSHAYPIGVDGKYYPSSSGEDLCWHLEQRTGWAWWNMAQGSTGPLTSNPPTNPDISPFRSPQRLAALGEIDDYVDLDLVALLGSVNDGGGRFTYEEYKRELMAYYAELAILLPGVPLVVIGPESGITFGYTDIEMMNNATKAACAESPNVACFLDYYGEKWFWGTGAVDAPTHVGNFDYAQSTDRVHLSPEGKKTLAELIDTGMEKA